jgi:5'-3' exonuclease
MFYGLNMKDHTVSMLRLSDVLESLDISFNQLQDFCIMCGTDYNSNIDRIGPSKSFDLIYGNGSLEKLTEKMDTSILNYQRVRELFNCDKYELQISGFNTIDKLSLDTTSLRKFCFYNNITFQKLMNL